MIITRSTMVGADIIDKIDPRLLPVIGYIVRYTCNRLAYNSDAYSMSDFDGRTQTFSQWLMRFWPPELLPPFGLFLTKLAEQIASQNPTGTVRANYADQMPEASWNYWSSEFSRIVTNWGSMRNERLKTLVYSGAFLGNFKKTVRILGRDMNNPLWPSVERALQWQYEVHPVLYRYVFVPRNGLVEGETAVNRDSAPRTPQVEEAAICLHGVFNRFMLEELDRFDVQSKMVGAYVKRNGCPCQGESTICRTCLDYGTQSLNHLMDSARIAEWCRNFLLTDPSVYTRR